MSKFGMKKKIEVELKCCISSIAFGLVKTKNMCYSSCSAKFVNVAEIALKLVVDTLIKEIGIQCGGDTLATGMPLAKLLARVTHVGPILLEEPSKNQFIQTIRNQQEIEVFFTLIYSNIDLED